MGTFQPTRAPLQLEKLENEELLQHYCETLEEMYVLALWERFMDRKNRKGLLGSQVENPSQRLSPGLQPSVVVLGKSDAGLLPVQEKYCEVCRTARYAKLYGLQKAAGEGFDHRRVPVPDRPE